MYAIIKTGGKQYSVKPGDFVEVEKLNAEIGATITFDEVLAVAKDGEALQIGSPLVAGVSVEAQVTDQFRGKKIVVFKMKRRKSYRRTQGHRQYLTRVQIGEIKA